MIWLFKYLAQKFIEDEVKGSEMIEKYQKKIDKAENTRRNLIDKRVK